MESTPRLPVIIMIVLFIIVTSRDQDGFYRSLEANVIFLSISQSEDPGITTKNAENHRIGRCPPNPAKTL